MSRGIKRAPGYTAQLVEIIQQKPEAADLLLHAEDAIARSPESQGSVSAHATLPVTLPGAETTYLILYLYDERTVYLKAIEETIPPTKAGFFQEEFDD